MKLKGAGFLPIFVILIFFHPTYCEKLVEVTMQITKLRFLPSASSDTRGFARQGQRFVVDGESGPWYRIRLYNSIVWISKDAVKVLEVSETTLAGTAATKPPTTPASGTPGQTPGIPTNTGARPGQPPTGSQTVTRPIEPSTTATSAAGSETTTLALAEQPPTPPRIPPAPTFRPGRIAPPAYVPKPQKKEPKPTATRTWFSQFSRVPQVPSGEEGKEIGFFQVVAIEAPVLYWPETSASILLKAKKGNYYVARETTDTWCKIVVRDTAGWVLRVKGVITAKPKSGFIDEFLVIIIIAALVIFIAIGVLLFIFIRRRARGKTQRLDVFHALILAKNPPNIQCIISNKTISLEKYLGAIGFSARTIHDLRTAQRSILKDPVDIVFIDWNISDDIPGSVEVLFANFDEQKLPLAIFYNVPDLSSIPLIPVLLRAYHLGSAFSDHDISKLITPTMLSKTSPKTSTGSALEGDIAEGNLPEILQFIEIGKKTGCLLVETSTPLGMIFFNQGRIVHAAAANNLQGRSAINSLLGLKQGHFRFLLNKEPKIMDLNLSTLEALMEWTKAQDEAHRD
jgi:hypothetical protein